MHERFKTILSGAGFYAALFLALAAVAVGGYFLLFHETQPAQPAVTASEPVVPAGDGQELLPTAPIVETVQPEPLPEEEAADAEPEPEEAPEAVVETAPVVAQAPSLVVSPLNGQVLAAFSVDALAYNATLDDWRTHDGVDIAAAAGTTVLAAAAGTVLSVEQDDLLGTTVVLGHTGGYQTTYANLQSVPTVKEGEAVSAGQVIGSVGTTSLAEAAEGPHLHFSVSRDGDLIDPEEYLKG